MYKLQGLDDKARTLYTQLKKAKPSTVRDYLDLSEITEKLEGENSAIRVLDAGIKKHPASAKLYFEKVKLYSLSNNAEKRQEVLDSMKKVFY